MVLVPRCQWYFRNFELSGSLGTFLVFLWFLNFGLFCVTHAVVGYPSLIATAVLAMSVIDVRAQQIVIDALRLDPLDPKNLQKIFLCHTPSKLSAESGMYLSTQDRLQELFAGSSEATIAVFPNANFVRRLCKQFQRDTFSIE